MEWALIQITKLNYKSIFFVVFYNKGYLNVQMTWTPPPYIFGWNEKRWYENIGISINALLVFPFNTKIE